MSRFFWVSLFAIVYSVGYCGASEDCQTFFDTFQSVNVNMEDLGDEWTENPIPEGIHRLEVGNDSECKIGDMAEIYTFCPNEDDSIRFSVIPAAPIIWSDSEGFTVVLVSDKDYKKLKPKLEEFFLYANCTEKPN